MADPDGHHRLGPDDGRLLLRTGRAGLASRVGHDLTIEVTRWSAEVDVPDGDPNRTSLTAQVDLDSLVVREGAGGATPLTDADRQEIQRNARKALSVDRYPTATFESTKAALSSRPERGTIEGTLTLHGAAAPLRLTVERVAPDRYRATATVVQSAHGIKPYSAFLGALRLRDEVEVEVEVHLGGESG